MEKIIITREGFLNMQICTTIPPEEKDSINDELRKSGLGYCGTLSGWMLDEDIEPVKCVDCPDRWHYLCKC